MYHQEIGFVVDDLSLFVNVMIGSERHSLSTLIVDHHATVTATALVTAFQVFTLIGPLVANRSI